MILSQRRFRLQNSLLLTLLVFSSLVLSQAQNNHINNNIIKGTLWTYEQDIPHQTSIVVEAISIDGNISKAAQSDFSGNYQLSDLIVGNYYLRCHGKNGFLYHQVNGQKTVIDVKKDSYVEGIDFVFAPFKNGQWQNYNYVEHGLAHEDVQSIYQATSGVVWFKTRGGISTFDGQKFTTIESTGGSWWTTGDFYEDSKGALWFGTIKGGVFQYRDNELEIILPHSQLSQIEVLDIGQDHDGSIWFGTVSGLFKYSGNTLTQFTTVDGLITDRVQQIMVDSLGQLWLAYNNQSEEVDNGLGLTKYDGKNFQTLTTQDGLPSNRITSFCQGEDHRIWIGTDKGLAFYQHESIHLYETQGRILDQKIHCLMRAKDKSIWIGSRQGITQIVNHCFINYTTRDGLASERVSCIFETKEGIIWIGTNQGVSRFDYISVANFSAQDGLASNQLSAIYFASDNRLWMTSNGFGLTSYDGQKFHHIETDDGLINSANRIEEGKGGILWFGRMEYQEASYGGLSSYDKGIVRHYSVENGLLGNNITAIHKSADGLLWIGSTNRGGSAKGQAGLSRFDGEKFTSFPISALIGYKKEGAAVRLIDSDSIGRIWIGTKREGLFCYDGKQFINYTTKDGLTDIGTRSLLVTEDNNLWVGGYQGVSTCNVDQKNINIKFKAYRTEDGLSYPEIKGGIYQSDDDLIWFGTAGGGVAIFDGQNWSSLDLRDGLASNGVYSTQGISQDHQGNMWFLMASNDYGVCRYRRSHVKPAVEIITLRIGKAVYTSPHINSNNQVTLGTRVTIQYNAIDNLTHPSKRSYRYRMMGPLTTNQWSRKTEKADLDYIFAKQGGYTFEVQAINRDLRYSESVSTSFEVVPVWYMNSWIVFPAGSTILVVFVLSIVNGMRYYQQRIESERLERETKQLQAQMLVQERQNRQALEAELLDARNMQMNLLPESAPALPSLQIAGRNMPAKEVGGDFFDYLEGQKRFTIAVGDVSGKGLKGAMNAVMASGILRLASDENPTSDSSDLISKVNKSLCQSMERDMNVTMVLAQFDLTQNQMTLANAGQHAYPLLKRGNSVESIQVKGLALGMIPSVPYKALKLELQSGDLLLFMTDGITEPRNAEGVMYEESGRFHQVISELEDQLTAEEVVETIIQDVINYMTDEEKRDDDITLVAVRVT